MKAKILLVVLFVFTMILFVFIIPSVLAENLCVDSDNGLNYFIKGFVNVSDPTEASGYEIEEDMCLGDDKTLMERFCQSGEAEGQTYVCPNGCFNGRCAEANQDPPMTNVNYCIETDSGIDIYTKGKATGPWLGDINGTIDTKEDFCSESDSTVLQEYTCEPISKSSTITGLVQKGIQCSRGCKNGACTPISCTDSDNGIDFYTNGHVRIVAEEIDDTDADTCVSKEILAEQSCKDGQQEIITYECPSGCSNGACAKIQKCSDSDGGNNAYEKGNLVAYIISSSTGNLEKVESVDYCVGDGRVEQTKVVEHYCIDDGMGGQNFNSVSIRCLNGCNDGACLKIEPTEETGPIELPEELTETEEIEDESEDIVEEEKKIICSGCVLEDKCFPFGFRKSGSYCSDVANQFIEQKQSESICENNFECTSNVCVSSKCVSPSLIEKIINWFKRLFGS